MSRINSFLRAATSPSAHSRAWSLALVLAAAYLAPAHAQWTVPSSVNFGDVVINQNSLPITIFVRNLTGSPQTLTGVHFIFPAPDITVLNDSCTGVLIPDGQSCQYSIRFSPQTLGSQQHWLQFSGTNTPPNVEVLGTGIAPMLSIDPTSVDFGDVLVGETSQPVTLTLRNTSTSGFGNQDAEITAINGPGAPFNIVGGTCPSTPFILEGGFVNHICTVEFEFEPSAVQSYSGDLEVEAVGLTSPLQVPLSGNGISSGTAALAITPNPANFGNQCLGQFQPPEIVTLQNTGTAVLGITSIDSPTSPFLSLAGSCPTPPFNLGAGDSCTREVSFLPLGPGVFNQALNINSSAPGSPHQLNLLGTAEHSVIFLPLSDLDFGQVTIGGLASLGMQVENQSATCAFDIDLPAALGPLPPEFEILPGTCGPGFPVTLNAGDTCILGVEFSPTSLGIVTHANQLGHLASSGSGAYTLAGEGVPSGGVPDVDIAPASWDFGTVALGDTAVSAISVSSVGSANLEIDDLSIVPSGPYFISGGNCTVQTVLMPGESCLLEIEFQPTAAGTFDGEVVLEFNVGTYTVPLTGIGAAGSAQLAITPASIDFGQQCRNELAPPQSVSLESIGSAVLSVSAIDAPSTPFGALPGTNDCPAPPFTLDVGDSCTRTFNFLPVSSGSFSQTLNVTSSDPGSPHQFALLGDALDVLIDGVTDIDFGAVAIGSTAVATMSLLNPSGSCSLEVVMTDAMGPLPPEFGVSPGTCPSFPFILGPGAGCELEFSFSPTVSGPVSHGNMLGTDATAGTVDYVLMGEGDDDPLFHDRFEEP